MFMGLGERRDLAQLLKVCHESGMKISYQTIKRYSSKFKWYELAQQTERALAEKIAAEMLPDHAEKIRRHLETINLLTGKFYEKVKRGEVDVDLEQFVVLVKTESMLTGGPKDNPAVNANINIDIGLDDAQLAAVLRLAEAKQRGLPPPDMIDVTPETDVAS